MKISKIIETRLSAKSPEQCLSSYKTIKEVWAARGLVTESYIPSDLRDSNDVAFGVTKSGRYLDATMIDVEDGGTINLGSISHGALLFAAGLSQSIDDPKPTDDYVVRGIVKKKLDNDIIFWEDTDELIRRRESVKIAVEGLLKNKLVQDTNRIFGAHDDTHLALVLDVVQGW